MNMGKTNKMHCHCKRKEMVRLTAALHILFHPLSVTMGRCQLAGTPRAWVGENDFITGGVYRRETNQSHDEFKLFSFHQIKLSVCLRNKHRNFSTGRSNITGLL
jgi:hypothetical protein